MKKTITYILTLLALFALNTVDTDASELEHDQPMKDSIILSEQMSQSLNFPMNEIIYTDYFSPTGDIDEIIIHEVVIDNTLTKSKDGIIPYRIEPGWATYISKAYWITRNGVKSISIWPRKSVKNWSTEKAWQEIRANFSFYKDWKNESVLRQQFFCHARKFPPYSNKIPWNIDLIEPL